MNSGPEPILMAAPSPIQTQLFPAKRAPTLAGYRSLAIALTFVVLLCSLVAREYPELLTLTDSTCNDYTLLSASSSCKAAAVSKEADHRAAAAAVYYRAPVRYEEREIQTVLPSRSVGSNARLRLICILRT
jgi:hypothetical protein